MTVCPSKSCVHLFGCTLMLSTLSFALLLILADFWVREPTFALARSASPLLRGGRRCPIFARFDELRFLVGDIHWRICIIERSQRTSSVSAPKSRLEENANRCRPATSIVSSITNRTLGPQTRDCVYLRKTKPTWANSSKRDRERRGADSIVEKNCVLDIVCKCAPQR